MTLAFYARYALRSLLRDGQRTLLAVLCITFGVMSLVAMQLLSGIIHDAVVTDPRATVGGDIQVRHERGGPFSPDDIAYFQKLQAGGTLSKYTLVFNTDFT